MRWSAATDSGPSSRSSSVPSRAAAAINEWSALLRAHGDDAQHRLVLDPPERELDRRRGRRVEPLEVVDRDGDGWGVRGERHEARRGARCRQAVARADGWRRFAVARRPVPRAAAPAGPPRAFSGSCPRRSARPANESRASDSAGRATSTDRAAFARLSDGLVPDRRLTDARLADDREDTGRPVRGEKRLHRGDLGVAPDDTRHARERTRR